MLTLILIHKIITKTFIVILISSVCLKDWFLPD